MEARGKLQLEYLNKSKPEQYVETKCKISLEESNTSNEEISIQSRERSM